MTSPTLRSYSQNGEDVVLWRALRHVGQGRYIEVGANHPCIFSVSMAFYQKGWSGITVEPDPEFAQLQRRHRPNDIMVEAAITATDGDSMTFHVVDGTGLSTLDEATARVHAYADYETHDITVPTRTLNSLLQEAGWRGQDIHFMSVDTEGSEKEVLESIDLSVWRPWVVLVEATFPLSTRSTRGEWEHLVTGAGYRFCLFDGLSCFYVADERREELGQALSYPACALDDYISLPQRTADARATRAEALAHERAQEIRVLVDEVVRWRGEAVSRWAAAITDMARAGELEADRAPLHAQVQAAQQGQQVLAGENAALRQRVADLEASTSWRVTAPLRTATGLVGRARGRR